MVELQAHLPTLAQQGIWACAISYDPSDVLAAFAQRFSITFPLLSDPDSAVIQQFGILNPNIPPEHHWHGVPFPGTYMVDLQGRVVARSFYADHAKRDAMARMAQEVFRVTDSQKGEIQVVEAGPVCLMAYLSSETIRPGQVVTLTAEVEIKKGYHTYGHPLPDGYVPTSLVVDALEGVQPGEVQYPQPKPYRFEALGEVLPAYERCVSLKVPVFSRRREDFTLRANLDYQVCDDHTCYLPQQLSVGLPVRCLPNVR